jgi:anti-sigma regulatory factor (Ser/Thr protein kinase)
MANAALSHQLNAEFDAGPSAASAARNALMPLEERVDPVLMDDLRLLVSELVTNSVRHSDIAATDTVELDVAMTPSTLRVEVGDPGSGFEPRPRDPNRTRPGGWGLYLVDRLADRWGVARNSITRVWFEIDRPLSSRPQPV